MATITVLNTNDSGAGSLRAAIAAAASGDTINFTGLAGTITLASELLIDKSLTITGPGAGVLTISGNNAVRVFHIENGGSASPETVSISNLTLTAGRAAAGTPGNRGGAVYVFEESLTLDHVNITNSFASGQAGGVYAEVWTAGAQFTLTNSTVSGNSSVNDGGGVFVYGAQPGSPALIQNNTITGNSAANGAGVHLVFASASILNSTIVGNTAAFGGGGVYTVAAALTLANSILANNTGGGTPDITGATTESYNLIKTPGTSGLGGGASHDITGQDPLLGALTANADGIFTMLPGDGSPVINAGNPSFTGLALDERGLPRVSGGRVDIGAVEVQFAPVLPPNNGGGGGGPVGGTPIVLPVPTAADLQQSVGAVLGIDTASPKWTAQTVTLADGTVIPNPALQDSQHVAAITAQFRAGTISYATAIDAVIDLAGPTTGAAAMVYKAFLGAFPTADGMKYLVDSPANPHDLTDPAYAGMSEANRFINLSVSQARDGAGAALFAQTYGALSFEGAARAAYAAQIGVGYAIVAGIDVDKAIAYLVSQQAYFVALGGTDIGAKAAMVGYLLSAAFDAHLGIAYEAAHGYLAGRVSLAAPSPDASGLETVGLVGLTQTEAPGLLV